MKVMKWLSLGSGVVVLLLAGLAVCTAGCSMTLKGKEYQLASPLPLHAYGREWTLVVMEREDSRLYAKGLAIGGAPRNRNTLYLLREDGTKLELSERIYVPQRDGSAKRISDCCDVYPPGVQAVQAVEGKLVLDLRARPGEVTDCPIPQAKLSDDREILFFGEFDPVAERVMLNSYFAGFKQENRARPFDGTVNQLYRIYYANRMPLGCG